MMQPGKVFSRTAIFLLLGAIVNVAVAWMCALYTPCWPLSDEGEWYVYRSGLFSPSNIDWWKCNYPFDQPALPTKPQPLPLSSSADEYACVLYPPQDSASEFALRGMDVLHISGTDVESGRAVAASAMRVRSGLPFRSMEGSVWNRYPPSIAGKRAGTEQVVRRGLSVNLTRESPRWDELTFVMGSRYLLLDILWPGFAINTIFYAALLWVLWFAPGKIRRLVRIRNGRCPACGYQIAPGPRMSDKCSECGNPLPSPFVQSQ